MTVWKAVSGDVWEIVTQLLEVTLEGPGHELGKLGESLGSCLSSRKPSGNVALNQKERARLEGWGEDSERPRRTLLCKTPESTWRWYRVNGDVSFVEYRYSDQMSILWMDCGDAVTVKLDSRVLSKVGLGVSSSSLGTGLQRARLAFPDLFWQKSLVLWQCDLFS